MAAVDNGVEIDPRKGSWGDGQHHTGSLVVKACETDDSHDIEEGGIVATPSALSHSTMRSNRPSVTECLSDVPEEEMADLSLDVYNMFFLSDIWSQAFFYSLAVLVVKISLYGLLMADLGRKHQLDPFLGRKPADGVVQIAQFFLIPVAIVTQEELITSFFIFSHLKYSPEILQRHPGAKKWKFFVAALARFGDGFVFLLCNTIVMLLQDTDVLALFLNFAALMFLQQIDNIALQVCVDGYWTRSLQEAAQDVIDMKFAYRHHYIHHAIQTSFIVIVWAAMLIIWSKRHFFDTVETETEL